MKHIAAYLLCVVGGNASPSAEDVANVITACGGEADEAQVAAMIQGFRHSPSPVASHVVYIQI